MECADFEARWNELLDERSASALEMLGELHEHAATCDSCRPLALRYQTLLHIVSVESRPPAPRSDFVERCLEAVARDRAFRISHRPHFAPVRLMSLAAAAVLLLAFLAAFRFAPTAKNPIANAPAVVQPSQTVEDPSLSDALANAGSATWDLARESSGSAAKLGREMFKSASLPPDSSLFLTVSGPSASDVFKGMSDRVNAGVQPLSATAKHAFGFLIGAAEVDATVPPT